MKLFIGKFIFLFFILCSCQTTATFYLYNEEVNFGDYASFNFYPPIVALTEADKNSIMDAIEYKLELKGVESRMDASSSVDFFVNFYDELTGDFVEVNPEMLKDNELTPSGFYIELIIAIRDAKTDELIWLGVGEKLISYSLILTGDNRESILQKLVKQVLQSYPPNFSI